MSLSKNYARRNFEIVYAEHINWCIEQHSKTNHFYDTYLPYEFHLRLVAQTAYQFWPPKNSGEKNLLDITNDVFIACWGHDLIEDARCSFNDVKKHLTSLAADIIYAVTNEKGHDRAEKANEKYYEGIRNTPGAVFVKLCDRIANVQYGKMTKNSMFFKYQKENPHFIMSLVGGDYVVGETQHDCNELIEYLASLLNNE